MLPTELAKSNTEHAHQRAFFQWLNFAQRYGFSCAKAIANGTIAPPSLDAQQTPVMPELALMHAIPNGGYRKGSEAAKFKAEGVKPGVPDTFLPVARVRKNEKDDTVVLAGLYVEFKKPDARNRKNGGLSNEQSSFMLAVQAQSYCVGVAYSWQEAANIVMLYYNSPIRFNQIA